jgi:ribosome-associated protein
MDSKQLAQLCRDYADNKKAEDVVILDVRKISTITDYFVIASGTSEPHLRAINDAIVDGLRDDHGIRPTATDGDARAPWQVLDYFDVIVHVMRDEVRKHYDLETLWNDAASVKPEKLKTSVKSKLPKPKRKPTLKRKPAVKRRKP